MNGLLKSFCFTALILSITQGVKANPSVQYPEMYMSGAKVQGQGRMTYWGFDLYDAKLLQLNNSSGYALRIDYLKNFKSDDLREQTIKEMTQLGVPEESRSKWSKDLKGIFPNIAIGNSLTAIYQPKVGTIFLHNEKYIGQMAGDDFSRAFFAIWLDPRTSAPELRSQLLSQDCTPKFISSKC
ncbi:MAG: hypothetical protein RLZZ410_907 [Pseudomonadota bacterium]|jgi:hypothetical protein